MTADHDQLRNELLALPESAVSLGVEGQAPYSCYEITEDQRTRLLAALASKTAIDPVTVVLEAYDDLRRYIYDRDAHRRVHSIDCFTERLNAIRALGKDQ